MRSTEGKYTKYLNFKSNDILAFVAKNENDNYFKVSNMIKEQEENYNGFQVCEEKEEFENFKIIYFINYSRSGEPMQGKFIKFDFENGKVTTDNGKSYKVKECSGWTYKIQKTQIKASEGIKGLYKHIIKAMHIDSPFNSNTYHILDKL